VEYFVVCFTEWRFASIIVYFVPIDIINMS